MKKNLLLLLLTMLGGLSLFGQKTYENFETGGTIAFVGLNGTYNGIVANPSSDAVNGSANVGSYTNAPAFDFCFALGTLSAPVDLSEYNLLKMKIWSPTAPCKALLKFEGGGNGQEKFVDITVANQWVEYEFDLSGGAAKTGMNKILVSFNSFVLGDTATYYFDDIVAVKNQKCYADFEGPGLTFLGLDGVLTAPSPNPGANQINSSANSAKYEKSNTHAYSLILADNGAAFDLSVYNVFKIKVYATAPTSFIFKLEGTGGGFEQKKNIAVTGAWQEYSFDFSAQAANTGLSKIVMFFDPGVETSGDTYYFDDVCAVPTACAGVTADPDYLDDFECNRNATYGGGWDSLFVVNNPHINGDNTSSKVGEWHDPSGPGTEWWALLMNNDDAIDLTTKNQFSLQVWAPKAGKLLMKLEGGPGAAKEVFVDMVPNQWTTYTADFSAQAGLGHKHLVLFFNAGVNGEAGDIYYFDNVKLAAKAIAPPLENFEGGLHLGWQPLDQNNTLHGNFSAPTANSNPNAVNGSANVGCYEKGASPFSTLQAFSLTNFDLSIYEQFNVDVLSPATAAVGTEVTMQLNSPTAGNVEAKAKIKTPGQWETLGFDFSGFNAVTDFAEIRLIFDANATNLGQSWCIDNVNQSKVTIDPCANTVPILNILDDYECQRNYVEIFYGKDDLKVVNNPYLAPANGSLKVGQYDDPANNQWAGLGMNLGAAPDLSIYNHLQMIVYAPAFAAGAKFLFKLEGGTTGQVEKWVDLPGTDSWVKFDVDFSSAVGTDNPKLIIFANGGVDNPLTTYYYDNIKWSRAGYNGCFDTHESPTSSVTNFKYFANGHLEASGYGFETVANPNPGGVNNSGTVGKFVKASDGAPYAGMYADLDAPIDWKGSKTMKASVLMDHIGNFTIKLEGDDVNHFQLENPVANTKTGEWERLSYDFSAVPDNSEFDRLTLFFDLGIDATGADVTSYFDDLSIGASDCISAIWQPLPVEPMKVTPNPTTDILRVENFRDVAHLLVLNALGQRVADVDTGGALKTELDVSRFPAGVYTLAGYNRGGLLVGNAKFVKQ